MSSVHLKGDHVPLAFGVHSKEMNALFFFSSEHLPVDGVRNFSTVAPKGADI